MKETNAFGKVEAAHALAFYPAAITLLVILLLFAGREATRLADHLLQDNDQAVSVELNSNDPNQAHEWFLHSHNFGTHDSRLPYSNGQRGQFAGAMVQAAIGHGHLDPAWQNCRHPSTPSNARQCSFGIDPMARGPTCGIELTIGPGIELT